MDRRQALKRGLSFVLGSTIASKTVQGLVERSRPTPEEIELSNKLEECYQSSKVAYNGDYCGQISPFTKIVVDIQEGKL